MHVKRHFKHYLYAIVTVAVIVFAVPYLSHASTMTARSLALKLTVHAESGAGYTRSAFKLWTDDDHDGCDTRKEVLIAESKVPVTIKSGCRITKGKWKSWYDGKTWTNPSDVDIDHVVPLKEAWESGAKSWTAATRTKYANDLSFSWTLDAITDNVNSRKGAHDPAEWLPPLKSARCAYATHWVAVKYRWGLSVDTAERNTLLSILSGSCGSKGVKVPAVVKTKAPKPNNNTNNSSNTNTGTNTNTNSNSGTCCKICTSSKACGDSCISRSYTCHKEPGCACDG